jgi:FdhD protein
MPAVKPVEVVCVSHGARITRRDRAATEEPLAVRLHGRPFAVIMRTPGADRELAAGFLLAEGVLKTADDLGTIEYCTDPDTTLPAEHVINVTLAGASFEGLEQMLAGRRQVLSNSSCGLCGRLTIESLQIDAGSLPVGLRVARSVISSLPGALRAHQVAFDATGGLHAAGLFTPDGVLEISAEDVGRHNAVDKVIGRMVMAEALPLSNHLLCVSGRVSFEIVQKALLAGIPVVAAVSAPSTLAIELAEETGVTLAAFVRGEAFNLYAHPERIL